MSAAVAALAVFVLFAITSLLWLWEPVSNPGEAYTKSETLNNLLVVGVVLFAVAPFAVLAGYFGGRFAILSRFRLRAER